MSDKLELNTALTGEEIAINICGNVVTITHPDVSAKGAAKEKSIISKTVSLTDLLNIFRSQVTEVVTPILPVGAIRYFEKGGEVTIIMFHETDKFDANLYTGDRSDGENRDGIKFYKDCIRPSVVMKHILRKGGGGYTLHNSFIWAVKESSSLLVNDNTPLYRLPFPNIYDDGRVCWGSANNKAMQMQNICGLKAYAERLFRSIFNYDLWSSGLMSSIGISSPKGLFNTISGKDTFPENLYFPLATPLTLGGICR